VEILQWIEQQQEIWGDSIPSLAITLQEAHSEIEYLLNDEDYSTSELARLTGNIRLRVSELTLNTSPPETYIEDVPNVGIYRIMEEESLPGMMQYAMSIGVSEADVLRDENCIADARMIPILLAKLQDLQVRVERLEQATLLGEKGDVIIANNTKAKPKP